MTVREDCYRIHLPGNVYRLKTLEFYEGKKRKNENHVGLLYLGPRSWSKNIPNERHPPHLYPILQALSEEVYEN